MAAAAVPAPYPGGAAAVPGDCLDSLCSQSFNFYIITLAILSILVSICHVAIIGRLSPPPPPESDSRRDPPPEMLGRREWITRRTAVRKFRNGGVGEVAAAECAVCLGEFNDGERLRLLPNCRHAFHVECIDPWLKWHVRCPLCRTRIAIRPPAAPAEEMEEAEEEV